jgi:argonaute-like protein implicated in RNA metabolism and viral defense
MEVKMSDRWLHATRLYYNSNAAIRLPAPLMYAHRLAKFAGTVLRREPSNDLRLTLYYL